MKPWVAIPLYGRYGLGQFALVDQADALLVVGYRWNLGGYYPATTVRGPDGKARMVFMHRLILGARPRQIIDHRNGDKKDNRRSNIRFATAGQNSANVAKSSGWHYRGVTGGGTSWHARCQLGGRLLVGHAETEIEAARLYDKFARELHGDFARLNFPRKTERSGFKPEARAA